MSEGSIEDEDDIFTENLNTVLFLFLGVLSIFVSATIIVHSATVAVYGQQLPMDFLNRLIFVALFFVIGFGSLHVFRKRRELRKRKKSAILEI